MFIYIFFFFNDTATTEIYTLSLHDALPISQYSFTREWCKWQTHRLQTAAYVSSNLTSRIFRLGARGPNGDRKSTRLNSSHANISYAVFCLKKKKIYKILR